MNGSRASWSLILILGAAAGLLAVAGFYLNAAPAPARFEDAVDAWETGDLARASTILDRYLVREPDNRNARLLRAQLALRVDPPDPDLALEQLDRIRVVEPNFQAIVKVERGRAWMIKQSFAKAEADLDDALRLDPKVAEAGWLLLQQYDLQGRSRDARELGLRMFAAEPDPGDRVRVLLELVRRDVEPLAAAYLIEELRPASANDPADHASRLALGRALTREGRIEEGIALLEEEVDRAPTVDAWDAYLLALGDAGEIDRLVESLDRLPTAIASDPRMAEHRGKAAQHLKDYPAAIAAYESTLKSRPDDDKIRYRLVRVFRLAGRAEDADREERQLQAIENARKELKTIYQDWACGEQPPIATIQRVADLLEVLGRSDEALCWHLTVLESVPEEPTSLRALERLGGPAS